MKNKKKVKKILPFCDLFLKDRKAELSTQQIITMIVLITSFVVVLFFLFRLNLGEESQDQLCYNSVLQKASVLSQAPLNCYRSYVCITEDGTCEGLIKPEKIKVDSLEKVYEALANEMAGCWWMFGAGQVNYVGDDFTKNNYCSICSQILFDDSLNNIEGIENEKISKDELYDYLTKNEYSKEVTYAEYILGTNDLNSVKGDYSFDNIEVGTQSFIVTGITSKVGVLGWVAVGAGAVTGVAAAVVCPFTGISCGVAVVLIGGAATAVVGGVAGAGVATVSDLVDPKIGAITVLGRGIDNSFMAPTILEVDSDKFKALNCEEILTYT